ncbi:hypothetical protein [Ruminococcus flavefaciens]|uniref:Uncharacterized protein n=1 Tax=Ruminococcus flavefaciens 007c TaxID=1341157 RepID=W7UKF7_RUMFL|nr:hypothetical protein [Ruminococcus flavefaciens]EWM54263.1 hypothetical protein RF007C_11680 [Ruminococcus flavefaciens 007c]
MVSGCLAKMVFSDVRHNYVIHYLTAVGILFLTPLLFGISQLDSILSAQPLEIILPLMGTVLMTPVFFPEQNENIRDVVRSKKTSYHLLCFIRIMCSVLMLSLFIGGFVIYMKSAGCNVTAKHFAGSLASALILGSAGFFAAAVSDNVIAGYMTSVIYYMSNFTMKDKLRVLYLFSMSHGRFEEKKYLVIIAAALVAGGFAVRKLMRK